MMLNVASALLIPCLFFIYLAYKVIFPSSIDKQFKSILEYYGIDVPEFDITCPSQYSRDFIREFIKILNCSLYYGVIRRDFARLKKFGFKLIFSITNCGTTCIDCPMETKDHKIVFPISINLKSYDTDIYTYPIRKNGKIEYAFLKIPTGPTIGHEFSHMEGFFNYLNRNRRGAIPSYGEIVNAWRETGEKFYLKKFQEFSNFVQSELANAIKWKIENNIDFKDLIKPIKVNVPELLKPVIPDRYYSMDGFDNGYARAMKSLLFDNGHDYFKNFVYTLRKEAEKYGRNDVLRIESFNETSLKVRKIVQGAIFVHDSWNHGSPDELRNIWLKTINSFQNRLKIKILHSEGLALREYFLLYPSSIQVYDISAFDKNGNFIKGSKENEDFKAALFLSDNPPVRNGVRGHTFYTKDLILEERVVDTRKAYLLEFYRMMGLNEENLPQIPTKKVLRKRIRIFEMFANFLDATLFIINIQPLILF